MNASATHRANTRSGRPRTLLVLFALVVSLAAPFLARSGPAVQKVCVVPIAGTVDPGMTAFVKRALTAPQTGPETVFIIEMDTFGGRVDSALQIVDTLLTIPKERTIAFVKRNAISAGALIALACGRLIMQENTTIGDCAPITYSNEGPRMLGEKFQSPLRAKFRALAKRNGYPEILAEAMVTADIKVYSVTEDGKTVYMDAEAYEDLSPAQKKKLSAKKTVVAKGELLTMDDTEALALGFSRMSVAGIDEALQRLGLDSSERVRIEEYWSETLVRFIGTITPILLMIGIAAIYTEIKAPGFGVPGIVGISCLALVFLNQYLVGLADYTELLILVAGMVLLGFELFVIPGFGIAGVAGLVLIAVGAILALQDFVIPDPALPWQAELLAKNLLQVLATLFAAVLLALFTLRYILPRLSVVVRGPYLDTTLKESRADSHQIGGVGVGDTGIAVTFLRPSGKVKIRGEIFDVITEGEFMEKGTRVDVSQIKGNRIIVARRRENG